MAIVFSNTDIKDVAILAGALGYLIVPTDLIPDIMGPLGFTDDAVALRYAFKSAINIFSPAVLGKAKAKTGDIFGDKTDSEALDKIVDIAAGAVANQLKKKK